MSTVNIDIIIFTNKRTGFTHIYIYIYGRLL